MPLAQSNNQERDIVAIGKPEILYAKTAFTKLKEPKHPHLRPRRPRQ